VRWGLGLKETPGRVTVNSAAQPSRYPLKGKKKNLAGRVSSPFVRGIKGRGKGRGGSSSGPLWPALKEKIEGKKKNRKEILDQLRAV